MMDLVPHFSIFCITEIVVNNRSITAYRVHHKINGSLRGGEVDNRVHVEHLPVHDRSNRSFSASCQSNIGHEVLNWKSCKREKMRQGIGVKL